MYRDPPHRKALLRSVAVILGFSLLGGCVTTSMNSPQDASIDSLEDLMADHQASTAISTDIDEAWDLVAVRDCGQAVPIAQAVLQTSPNDMDARLISAECAAMAEDPSGAGERYENILAEAREPRALRGLGVLRAREGRLIEAETLLHEAALAGPDDWRTWNALGYISDAEGNWSEAAESYERAASLAPGRAPALNNLGLSLLQQGETQLAIDTFIEAISREPDFEPASENLRMAMILNGHLEDALWGLAEERRPVVLNNAGVFARSQGDEETAAILFRRALDESPIFYERAFNNLRALDDAEL